MSDMPSMGGEGLASWVRMHDVSVSQAEQQLSRETSLLQHRMGVAGIKAIAATHIQQEAGQGPPPPIHTTVGSPGPNALTPPGGGEPPSGEGAS
jgi:hypothetical protein